MRFILLLAVPWTVGCVAPRSMTLGMTAAPLGSSTEVSVFSGVGYAVQSNAVTTSMNAGGDPVRTQTQHRAFGAPTFEANVTKGLSDHFALNVHASPAGLQPGLKWTINRSRVFHIAALPAVAFGYSSLGTADYVQQPTGAQTETNPRATTSFTFLGGLKLLFSHESGFYAGAGYDFVFHRSNSSSAPSATADRTDTITQTTTHQIMAAVGFSIALGQLSIRPELAFAVNPTLAQTVSARVGATSTGNQVFTGGGGWAILPGFSVAVATPKEKADPEADEEAQPPSSRDDTTDDAVEEEKPKGPARKRTGDEDDDRRRKRRRSNDDDSEE
jgi:hypothetical protein